MVQKNRLPLLSAATFVFLSVLLAAVPSSFAQTPPGPAPAPPPQDLAGKTGDFADRTGKDVVILSERGGHLYLTDSASHDHLLNALASANEGDRTEFTYASSESDPWVITFKQRQAELVEEIFAHAGPFHRLPYSSPDEKLEVVKPSRSIDQLRTDAQAATPPAEKGPFRNSDLVGLAKLDPSIHFDIRYATSNNFLGTPVYTQARAFLQRPASEALLRAVHKLQPLGYGILIHDAYRPWYVTKIFWEATPPEGKIFVADPAQGSRHNRGCAVDLTLYELKSGAPVRMTGTYDEMSPRSFPNYPGGTSLERWHRDLLRWAMESEGFTVYDSEWWHFDFKDWHDYSIENTPFEKLNISPH